MRYSFNELRRRFGESGVIVYAVGISVSCLPKSHGGGRSNDLASITGGKAFFPDNLIEMNEALERIALELRHQYSIGYRPPNFAATGNWHRLKVKVTASFESPRLFVRSREGYYASAKKDEQLTLKVAVSSRRVEMHCLRSKTMVNRHR